MRGKLDNKASVHTVTNFVAVRLCLDFRGVYWHLSVHLVQRSVFVAVWISLLFISIFATPALRLLEVHPQMLQFNAQLARLSQWVTCKVNNEDENKELVCAHLHARSTWF